LFDVDVRCLLVIRYHINSYKIIQGLYTSARHVDIQPIQLPVAFPNPTLVLLSPWHSIPEHSIPEHSILRVAFSVAMLATLAYFQHATPNCESLPIADVMRCGAVRCGAVRCGAGCVINSLSDSAATVLRSKGPM